MSPSGLPVEGSTVFLSCSSDANPKANYIWYSKSHDWVGVTSQNFTIPNIKQKYSGYYFCEAWNTMGRINSSFLLITVAGQQGFSLIFIPVSLRKCSLALISFYRFLQTALLLFVYFAN